MPAERISPKHAFIASLVFGVIDLAAINLYFGPRALATETTSAARHLPAPTAPSVPARAAAAPPASAAEPVAAASVAPSPPAPTARDDRITGVVASFDSERVEADVTGLRRLAAELVADPSAEVVLEGHSDPTGNEYYNLTLSLDRANWARDRLADYGVSRTRVRTVGLGSARPLVEGTLDASGINRRVEVRWVTRTSEGGSE